MDIWRFLSGHTDSMGYTLAQSLICFDGWAHESTLFFYFKLHCWKPQLNGYVGANHLWSGVRIPCTPSTLFIVKFCATCIRHCAEKRMKINKKRPGLAQNYIVEVHGGEVADYCSELYLSLHWVYLPKIGFPSYPSLSVLKFIVLTNKCYNAQERERNLVDTNL